MGEDLPRGAEDGAPQPGEQVHLPGASYLPAWTAFGITIALVGVILTWVITAIGVVIAAAAIWKWIGETRRDIEQLPLQH